MNPEQHRDLMAVLERIAVALERLAWPMYTVTFDQPPADPPADPYKPGPYPFTPYTPYYTGDPLPPQRPENIC